CNDGSRRCSATSGIISEVLARREAGSIAHRLDQAVLVHEVVAELDRAEHDDQHQRNDERHLCRRGAADIATEKSKQAHHLIRYGTSCRITWPAVDPEPPATASPMISAYMSPAFVRPLVRLSDGSTRNTSIHFSTGTLVEFP